MVNLCSSCGSRPAVSGEYCGTCESEMMRLAGNAYPAWSEGIGPHPGDAKRHEKRVEEARQWLAEMPDLYAQLAAFVLPGSAPKDPDQRSGRSNPAWRSVLNLDVIDLTDMRIKDGADDTRTDYDLDRRAGARRQGVVNTLASWVRLAASEMYDDGIESEPAEEPTISSECSFLLTHLDWISDHQWFDAELHPDLRGMRHDVRDAMGERDKPVQRFVCGKCSSEAVLVAGGFLACTMTTLHDTSVRDLEGQYRRRAPQLTEDICREFGVSKEQLWQWKARRKIKPTNPDERRHKWLPWDVFSLLNPDLRAAIDMRDAAEAS